MSKKSPITAKGKADLKEAAQSGHPLATCDPFLDRVVVKRDMPKKQTEGGILLPESVTNKKQQTGTVIRVGPGLRGSSGLPIALDKQPGDRVIITGYAGLEVQGDSFSSAGDEYVMLRDEDVVARLNVE